MFSYLAKVLSGVPQGIVLGSFLFVIFANDMQCMVKSSEISSFVDDTRIFKAIPESRHCAYLQKDLDSITNWSKTNNMLLHEDKFEFVNFNIRTSKFPLANLPFHNEFYQYTTSQRNVLEPSSSVTDLGIIITEDLQWSSHISVVVNKAKRKAGWV